MSPTNSKNFDSLRSLLAELQVRKQIIEINAPVDPNLELAEIHRRVVAAGGPALLFKNVVGSPFSLVTNLFGTTERVNLAFGNELKDTIAKLAAFPHSMLPPALSKVWAERNTLSKLFKVGTSVTSESPATEVIETPANLAALPFTKSWPADGGFFLTLPLVYTEDPETKISNLGMYRMQRFDAASTGMHFQIGKGGGYHLFRAKELGKKLACNVFLGGPPALILSAIAPLPENVPELLLASLVQGKKLKISRNSDTLLFPATAECVLCGSIDPRESKPEGPFGDHYGYYSLEHDFPVFRVDKVLRRRDAIFPATVVGKPRQEDFYIGNYLQEALSPLFPLVMPGVKSLWSFGETGFHSLSAAQVRERYRKEALSSAFRILGEGQLSLTKFLLLTDQTVNLRSIRAVLEVILERYDPAVDLHVFQHTSMDTLDYTGRKLNEGSKGVLIGVGNPIRTLPRVVKSSPPNYLREAAMFCAGCIVVSGESFTAKRNLPEKIAAEPYFTEWPLVVLVDDVARTVQSDQDFLWTVFTRFDPGHDLFLQNQHAERFHVGGNCPLVIDARMKPSYPAELVVDDQTDSLVTKRWGEYFK